jgi:hypothetical protein
LSSLTLLFGVMAFWAGLILKALPLILATHHHVQARCVAPAAVVSLAQIDRLVSALPSDDPATDTCLK